MNNIFNKAVNGDVDAYKRIVAMPKEKIFAHLEPFIEEGLKKLPEGLFGFGKGYDIRGNAQPIAGGVVDLTAVNVYIIGKLLGTHYADIGDKALVTGDIRNHTPILRYILTLGAASAGVDVEYAPDFLTTGAHNLLSTENEGNYKFMVQVSGSHGVPQKNGLKIKAFLGKKDKGGRVILEPLYAQRLEGLYWKDKANKIRQAELRRVDAPGAVKEVSGLAKAFVDMIDRTLPPVTKDEIVVIDPRAGAAGPTILQLLIKRGFSIVDMDKTGNKEIISRIHALWNDSKGEPKDVKIAIMLNAKPDGNMGRGVWDPSKPEALKDTQELVKLINANLLKGMPKTIGAVFDGDGDRISVILEDGRGVPAFEMTLPYYQRFLLSENNQEVMALLAKAHFGTFKVVCDVRANSKLLALVDKVNKQLQDKSLIHDRNIINGFFITTGYPPQLGFMNNRIDELDKFVMSRLEFSNNPEFEKKFSQFKHTYFTAEASGHNFFHISERYPNRVCDCAISGLITLLNIRETLTSAEVPVKKTETLLSDIFANFPVAYSSNEIRVPIPNPVKIETAMKVGAWMKKHYESGLKPYTQPIQEDDYLVQPKGDGYVTVSGFRIQLTDGRSALVRWSNTGEELTTIFEGPDWAGLVSIMKEIADRLRREKDNNIDVSGLYKEIGRIENIRVASAIWAQDPSIWEGFPHNEGKNRAVSWMGWMRAPKKFTKDIPAITDFAKNMMYKNIVVLGTGGSGRGARTLSQLFGTKNLIVTYSPQGEEIKEVIKILDTNGALRNTLFIVASKSGTTTETVTQESIFRDMLETAKKAGKLRDDVKDHFVAITDEGTPLDKRKEDYRRVFINNLKVDNAEGKDIGGRFSVLSFFGLVPLAATKGLDIGDMLNQAVSESNEIAQALNNGSIEKVIGFNLGNILAGFNLKGLDHIVQIPEETTAPTGPWAEQLFNESLAKSETAPLWVYGEPLLEGSKYYGENVMFVKIAIGRDKSIKVAELNGRPLIEVTFKNIGQLVLNLELAVTIWGYNLMINPFIQESVENSKNLTRKVIQGLETARNADEAEEMVREAEEKGQTLLMKEGIKFYFTGKTVLAVENELQRLKLPLQDASAKELIAAFMETSKGKDYIGLFSYTNEDDRLRRAFTELRANLKKKLKNHPTTLFDFGPGFHHSNNVAITCKDGVILLITFESPGQTKYKIPGKPYNTDQLIRAMVVGELGSLQNGMNKELVQDMPIERRVMRIHLPAEYRGDLKKLTALLGA